MPDHDGGMDEPEQCGMGPFSIVWGLAIALVTALLYKYKDRSNTIFIYYRNTAWWCV